MDLFHASCVMGELEKHTSCCKALEHLESSGIKAFMIGPISCKLCDGGTREAH